MLEESEISGLMNAVSNSKLGLSGEILQIVSESSTPLCCKDIYEKSVNASDSMTLSVEVNRMTVKHGLLEVAKK